MKFYGKMPGRVSRIIVAVIVQLLVFTGTTWGADEMQAKLISRAEIQGLPYPVIQFLEYSGVIGSPRITRAIVEQEGLFKTAPHKPWVPFTATQIYDIKAASFEWKVRMKMAPGIIVKGTDALRDGRGSMKIKLFGLIPLVNAQGPELDQGAMTRYLSETIWFPQAFLDDHISWEAIDSLSAKAFFVVGDKMVQGIFHFNDLGQITSFECERYAMEDKKMVLRPWRTPVVEYGERTGLMLGIRGFAIWDLPDGDFEYVDVKVIKVTYE